MTSQSRPLSHITNDHQGATAALREPAASPAAEDPALPMPRVRPVGDGARAVKPAVTQAGCLLVVATHGLAIEACSANCEQLLGMAPSALLGLALGDCLPEAADAAARLAADPNRERLSLSRLSAPRGALLLEARLQRANQHLLLELEPALALAMDLRLAELDLAAAGARLSGCRDLAEIAAEAACLVQRLTGHAEVSVLRWEANGRLGFLSGDGAGQRDAEQHYAELVPLRGRHWDIVYEPDASAAPVPLVGDGALCALDIAGSQLCRWPVQAGGAAAWLFLSLPGGQGGAAWGGILCRHPRPQPVSPAARARLLELAALVAVHLMRVEQQGLRAAAEQGSDAAIRVLGEIGLSAPFPASLAGKEPLLCRLLDADGVEYLADGEPLLGSASSGLEAEHLDALLALLRDQSGAVWFTDDLASVLPGVEGLSAVLALRMDDAGEDWLLFGRHARGGERPWRAGDLAAARALYRLIRDLIIANAARFEEMERVLAEQSDRLKRSRREVEYLSKHDALTGLPNRKSFRGSLEAAIANAGSEHERFAVALLDLDHFHAVNDTLGHDQGDLLLCAVAERIMDVLQPRDVVARLGGDEFALLLHDDGAECCATAEKVVETLRAPIDDGENCFAVTASVGISIGDAGSDPSELMKQADLAVTEAKRAGRDRVQRYAPDGAVVARQAFDVERAVLGSSPQQSIEIRMQPLVPIAADCRERRFEILARWRTADGSVILPTDFLPAAERNGLMRELTRAVAQRAIEVLRQRPESEGCIRLGMNVCAADLGARWFARGLLEDLRAADVPPRCIEIEITEDLLQNMDETIAESLRVLSFGGVHFAVDDFGTGFTSISRLRELPVEVLKIDRRFIRGLTEPQGPDRDLVAGVIALARSLGKTTVAEGVETEGQLKVLEELGCDWGQGYLWSRPLPPRQALALAL